MSKPSWMTNPAAPIPHDVEGLIFDCDGTLVDSMPTHYVAWCDMLKEHGIALSEERFYSLAGWPTVTIIEMLAREKGIACDAQAWAERKEQIYFDRMHTLQPIPSVIELARRESGHRKLAVASGGWRRLVSRALAIAGISELFTAVVCADDVKHGKPAPDTFLRAAELIGVAPERCLVYEDGEPGFVAARAAGMRYVDVRLWYAAPVAPGQGRRPAMAAAGR